MTLSIQKFLLVILFKCLLVSCAISNLRLDKFISPQIKQKEETKNIKNDDEDISFLEKKNENKDTPVLIYFNLKF